ncbi:MAG: hypothetical protein CMM52_03020 [Rhodospirillaceae bacterium]|nr:hypothetical protein [Rhodospirillaceae bacterium]|tara:strand:- start:9710 stop:10192 length:483 start_codon:yes stop_codon:yes gene_type:complete
MGLFQTLINPQHEEHPERAEVARAANLLQIGEFQLLQLAYNDWCGKDMPAGESDRIFGSYMIYNQVPAWARHYARHIISLDQIGMLDDRDPIYHRYDPEFRTFIPDGLKRFCGAAAVIVFFIGGGIWLSHLTTAETSQVLPPYFSDETMKNINQGPNPTP